MPQTHNDFNPVDVPLAGANLIEASAGTGKTYSIAILALRLILEKGLPVDEVLMVTFTRDAAAEMQLRVRSFIRQALQIASGNLEGADPQIQHIVERQQDRDLAINRLKNALIQFDQSSIFTIHGFCARVLSEYAFESGQLFNARTIEPVEMNELIADAFNQEWRDQVTTLEEFLLISFIQEGSLRDRIWGLVNAGIAGKKIYVGETQEDQSLNHLWNITLGEYRNHGASSEKIRNKLISILAAKILKRVEERLAFQKTRDAVVNFDDMIIRLHRVICNPEANGIEYAERLIKVLQNRYSAVFIDEFQDTDQLQFEIFHKVFRSPQAQSTHTLFFIGDPKQSIYAFRKADLQTYFRAGTLVDHIWRMNTNFRSTAGYIQAILACLSQSQERI